MTTADKPLWVPEPSFAEVLNLGCFCRTLDPDRLREEIDRDSNAHGLMQNIAQTRPHLFSSTAVFLTPEVAAQLAATVQAIERVTTLPGYAAQALLVRPALRHMRLAHWGCAWDMTSTFLRAAPN